jgi:subtilase family serine protease
VKGKDATGQNDCDPGRNDVTVAIRNDGDTAATSIAVRLVIDDDDDGSLRTVSSLDPGKETNVEFNRVELKKGQRQLTAAVDPHKLIAESSEDNNELKISVRCKDEGNDDD